MCEREGPRQAAMWQSIRAVQKASMLHAQVWGRWCKHTCVGGELRQAAIQHSNMAVQEAMMLHG
eukprot:265711-Chlamydomonas_euryale.AAC.2